MLVHWVLNAVLTVFEKNVYFKKNTKNWLGRCLPQWGNTRLSWGETRPTSNLHITSYLATVQPKY